MESKFVPIVILSMLVLIGLTIANLTFGARSRAEVQASIHKLARDGASWRDEINRKLDILVERSEHGCPRPVQ